MIRMSHKIQKFLEQASNLLTSKCEEIKTEDDKL
jgi:hypothetical protein